MDLEADDKVSSVALVLAESTDAPPGEGDVTDTPTIEGADAVSNEGPSEP
jgi:hypothetical protein